MKHTILSLAIILVTTAAMSAPPDLLEAERIQKDQREAFTQSVEDKVEEWNRVLDELNEGRGPAAENQITIDQLRPELNVIENNLARIKNNSSFNWQAEQRQIQEGLYRMQETFREHVPAE